jgi:carbonic anhydrase/acetyltransferase-like protein (isoleucine patch superfamily)
MKNFLPVGIIGTITTLAMMMGGLPFLLALETHSTLLKLISLAISFPIFAFTYILVAGLMSLPAHKAIKKGKFPRELNHPIYFWRRFYGINWTTVYYAKPIYAIALSIPGFKLMMFRLFGYQGSTDFTVYPDTWIRDLPVLKIGQGAYLSNRATIGTNICLMDGSILVDYVQLDEKALVGHLAVIGPGAKIGTQSEIGVGATVGIKTRISPNVKVGINATVIHGAVIDPNCQIGNSAYIGLRAHIYPNVSVPPGAVIPAGTIVKTQEDMNALLEREKQRIEEHKDRISSLIA